MSARASKTEFLRQIMSQTRSGIEGAEPLMTTDDFARDHVRIACEAIQLGLIRPYWDAEWGGYELRITRAGKLLANGLIDEAAATLDAGRTMVRISGPPPEGALGSMLYPGGPGMPLHGMAARSHAPEMIRGVATGHLRVEDGTIHAVADPAISSATWGVNVHAAMAGDAKPSKQRAMPVEKVESGLPSSRSARHVGAGKP